MDERTSAVELKRFFKRFYGIPVRVNTSQTVNPNPYIQAWIKMAAPLPGESRVHGPVRYDHLFPPELGNCCMRIVYPASAELSLQTYGGNIQSNMITMRRSQWVELLEILEPSKKVEV